MAVVTPLLKKASLEPHELKNYRLVSNLSFVLKLVESRSCSQAAYWRPTEITVMLKRKNKLPEWESEGLQSRLLGPEIRRTN